MTPVALADALLGVAALALLVPALPRFRRRPRTGPTLLTRYLYVGSHRTYR